MESPLVTLELDTAAFDSSRFALDVETASAAGFSFLSMAHLGDTYTTRMRLFALAEEIVEDSPGADPIESGFWEFVNQQIAIPSYDPRGVILAIRDGKWLGLSVTTDYREGGYMFDEHVWVAPSYRRLGLALSMKAQAIRFATQRGVKIIRAEVGSDDTAELSLYRTLGFKEPFPGAQIRTSQARSSLSMA